MPNENQLKLIKEGVEVWNRWRANNPEENINLSFADLSNVNLQEVNLTGANLWRAKIEGANLTRANLSYSNLERANLYKAWLLDADLTGANLSGGFLCEASLAFAYLWKANLHGANFEKAEIVNTCFAEANLTNANMIRLGRGMNADFTGAILENVHMYESHLSGNFTNANLQKALLQKSNFSRSTFTEANLTDANLTGTNLQNTHFQKTDLTRVNLTGADLTAADLTEAILQNANLQYANLHSANFTNANLTEADLYGVNLIWATLKEANLTNASLMVATMIETDLESAILTNCQVFGVSTWSLKGLPKDQSNLIITRPKEPLITVDDLQVAQFIYLLLNNQNIRNIIDTITSKAVLILGRFTDERKAILDALHHELRKRNYSPILFDFTGPQSRDITETVSTLAHMARFVIADITDAKSIPQELQAIVPFLPSVPVQPMLLASEKEYGMFEHFKRYPWVLPTYYYNNANEAVDSLIETILPEVEAKVKELGKNGA